MSLKALLIKLCHLICFHMFPNTVAIFVESGGYSAPYQVCQSAVTETETSVGLWHWELHESPQKRTLWEKNLIRAHAHLVKGKKCSNQTVEKCSVDLGSMTHLFLCTTWSDFWVCRPVPFSTDSILVYVFLNSRYMIVIYASSSRLKEAFKEAGANQWSTNYPLDMH